MGSTRHRRLISALDRISDRYGRSSPSMDTGMQAQRNCAGATK